MSNFSRIKIIANPIAGSSARARVEKAFTFLSSKGAEVDLFFTASAGDAELEASRSVENNYSLIIAAGGDGTLNEVINGMHGSKTPLAFLPLGTTNVFAIEIGMPFSVEKACEKIISGTVAEIYLGRVDKRLFTLMTSAGFDAEAVHQVSGKLKSRLGKAAYVVSALQALLGYDFRKIVVELDKGRVVEGYGAVISKARCYGGRFVLTPKASIHQPSLEVCVFTRPGRFALFFYSLCMVLRRPFPSSMATYFTAQSATISGKEVAVQVDGDKFSRGGVAVTVEQEPICMVMP